METQKNAPVGDGKALLERPVGGATDQGRNLCAARRIEHNLQTSVVEGKAIKERQSLSVENGYASDFLKTLQEPMTIHYQRKRHEGCCSCSSSDHGECTSKSGSW